MAQATATRWSLEVVRGRDVGRTYTLRPGETLLGNAPNGDAGVDLADQEGASPRRMAARQARLVCSDRGLTLDDLESPGGTFVNRQRLLPGQARVLQPGDVIQLGSVQLKVLTGHAVAPPAPAAPPAPGPMTGTFVLASGPVCRSWDDFLTVAAQRWPALREELTSGRLAAFLAAHGRADLIPSPTAAGSPDERLDDWLGRLPTTRASRPELEVHPAVLVVRAAPGGGVIRRNIEVANVGYRLLRSTLRPEPGAASWVVLPSAVARTPVVTVERTEVPIELHVPADWGPTLVGGLVVESNGGTRRVEIRLERPPAAGAIPDVATSASAGAWWNGVSRPGRFALLTVGAVAQRAAIALGGVLFGESAGALSLRGGVAVNAVLGALVGAWLGRRAGELRDLPTCALAGAMGGVLLAAVGVAVGRAVEPLVPLSHPVGTALALLLWAGLGAAAAAAWTWLVPPPDSGKGAQS
jgi:hypothetical protein